MSQTSNSCARSELAIQIGMLCLCLIFGRFIDPCAAQEASRQAVLDQPVTLAWSNLPFRAAMANLASTQHVPILLDRRVDPDAPITLAIARDPLRLALDKIAVERGLAVASVGKVIYLGPADTARKLKTVATMRRDDLAKLPAEARQRLGKIQPWQWEDLAEPRALVEQLAVEGSIKLHGLDQVPHDLWPAVRLPPLAWIDRLSLFLASFDLTFELGADGHSAELVPIPQKVAITRQYAGGDQPEFRAKQLATKVPDAQVRVRQGKIEVVGRAEDQELAAQLLAGRSVRTTTVKAPEQQYKLNVENAPLDRVLGQLGTMLKLDVHYDQDAIRAAGIRLDQLVSVHVEKVSLDELLAAVVKTTGLEFVRNEKTVTIKPDAKK
jgi:hypothetical protein